MSTGQKKEKSGHRKMAKKTRSLARSVISVQSTFPGPKDGNKLLSSWILSQSQMTLYRRVASSNPCGCLKRLRLKTCGSFLLRILQFELFLDQSPGNTRTSRCHSHGSINQACFIFSRVFHPEQLQMPCLHKHRSATDDTAMHGDLYDTFSMLSFTRVQNLTNTQRIGKATEQTGSAASFV